MKKKCPNCGTEVDEDAEFCTNCWYVFDRDDFPEDLGLLGVISSSMSTPQNSKSQLPPRQPSAPTNPKPVSRPIIKTQPAIKPVIKPKTPKLTPAQPKPTPLQSKPTQPKPKTKQAPLKPIAAKPKTFKQQMNEPIKLEQKKKQNNSKLSSMVDDNPYIRALYRLIGIFILLIAVFAVVCVIGSNHYSKDKQVATLTTDLNHPQKKIEQAHFANKKLTAADVKPLQEYYAEHPAAFKKLKHDLNKNKAALKLVQNGNYFSLFPKYILELPIYKVTVETNQAASGLTVNQKDYGQLNKEKTLKLYPGTYNFVVTKKKQKVTKQEDVWTSKNVVLKTKIIKKKKIKPKKKILTSSQMIVALLERNFRKPHAKDFVRGTNNASYQILANTTKNTQRVNVRLRSKIKTGKNNYFVAYQVVYKFTSGARRIFNYSNCTIKNGQIVSIGNSRLVG